MNAAKLQCLAENLWVVQYPFSVAGLQLGTRTTIIRLPEGLWVHSPGPLTPELRHSIEELGPVAHIVAPNTMHYLFFAENHHAFPHAQGWATEALRRKASSLPVDRILDPRQEWGPIKSVALAGIPKLQESVFYHGPSRSLVVTDLVFNIQHSEHWLTRAVMKMNGAYEQLGPSRIFRHLLTSDRRALGEGLKEVLQWDFERIIMAHGQVLENGGHQALEQAFSWALTNR